MSGPDAMHGEMPGFFPGRPGGERDEPLLDMIFDRRPLPPGAPPEMHDLARMLAAAAGPAEPGELAGEATALAAFARLASPVGISPAASRPARRRLPGRPRRARLPMAAALVTAAAGLGSIAAAYVGVLPGPIQQVAHVTVGAPLPPITVVRTGRLPSQARIPSVTPLPGISVTRPAHSAAPTRAHGGTASHWPRHRTPVQGQGPAPPAASPGRAPLRARSSPARPRARSSRAPPRARSSRARPERVTPSPSPARAATPARPERASHRRVGGLPVRRPAGCRPAQDRDRTSLI